MPTTTMPLHVGALGNKDEEWDCDVEYDYSIEHYEADPSVGIMRATDNKKYSVIKVELCDHTPAHKNLDVTQWIDHDYVIEQLEKHEGMYA